MARGSETVSLKPELKRCSHALGAKKKKSKSEVVNSAQMRHGGFLIFINVLNIFLLSWNKRKLK